MAWYQLLKPRPFKLMAKSFIAYLGKVIKLDICIKVDPKHALAYYMIGKSQMALGNKPLAKNAFQNASNFDTSMVEAIKELKKLN